MTGVELVEALVDALPGPTWDRPICYRITSAIVDWPCPGTVTVEVREECGCGLRRKIGKPHDVTIDLDDLMLGHAPKRMRAALERALSDVLDRRERPWPARRPGRRAMIVRSTRRTPTGALVSEIHQAPPDLPDGVRVAATRSALRAAERQSEPRPAPIPLPWSTCPTCGRAIVCPAVHRCEPGRRADVS